MRVISGSYARKVSLLVCGITVLVVGLVYSQSLNIKNDVFWDTIDGDPIYSQGGGIFQFRDPKTKKNTFYWYGVEYEEAVKYRQDPSVTYTRGNRFNAVTCYTSTDLVNWESEGEALTREEAYMNGGPRGWPWIARLGVAYFEDTDEYVMVTQYGAGIFFAVADSPAGPFKWHRRKDMTETIGTPNTGDQTVFTDEDTGKSYLVYSYGKGRNRIYISEIGRKDGQYDLLDCTQVYKGSGREGNCMFKYKGRYYLAASNLYGWDSSYAYYLVADDIRGPYRPQNDMQIMPGVEEDYAHITQTGFFVTLKGTEKDTVIYCGDRWAAFAGNGLGYNQWCPLSFDGDEPYFNSMNSWNLNAETGEWRVADDNNWVKNASFEADRKEMPSAKKPVQTRLMGWETKVLDGREISLEPDSPKLNCKNSEEDRRQVIGERSLNMSDTEDFRRQVFQIITSSSDVEFENGEYTLTAKVLNSDGFNRLGMYAKSGRETFQVSVKGENEEWDTIAIERIQVKRNEVEIGFLADGEANAFCRVDDVVLVKAR